MESAPTETSRVIDFHSHLIPGVDDGASTPAEARAALERMRHAGVATVVTTPHFRASATHDAAAAEAELSRFDRGWKKLVRAGKKEFPGLRLERGVELALDVPDPDLSDPRLRLAGTRFVLLEFSSFQIPPRSSLALAMLRESGWVPIVAHPERYAGIERQVEQAGEWREAGAYLQVNGGSLLGRYGAAAKQAALALLERGWVDYLSSDFHARGEPGIREYCGAMEEMGGSFQLELLTVRNPGRMLEGEEPLPVPPLVHRKSWYDWLPRWTRGSGVPEHGGASDDGREG